MDNPYNDDLITKDGKHDFRFRIGDDTHLLDLWSTLFDLDLDESENARLCANTDDTTIKYKDLNEYTLMCGITKAGKIHSNHFRIGALKMDARIVHWIVAHILRPKGTGKSQGLCYFSMISVILNHFKVGKNDIVPLKKLGSRQTFNSQTMNGFMYYFHENNGYEYKSIFDVMIHHDEPDPNDEAEKDGMAVDEENLMFP
ncbi:hypothetical protein TSUD_147760 [Trifolium subterraneum]|uniref:Uncharacterized protein n=1 Tax=Trifolium subterraneum TaxID=3900 RepID=A0A2Z6N2T5_TRISU|nr:hypothetical protein TSUD_147760 [Trifolium subterraneum]